MGFSFNFSEDKKMYGDYKEHWSMVDERMNSAVHENYPEWKKAKDRRSKHTAPCNVTYVQSAR